MRCAICSEAVPAYAYQIGTRRAVSLCPRHAESLDAGWTFAYVGLYTFEAVVAALRAGRRVDARWPDGAASACFMDRSTAAPIVCWYSRSAPLRRYDSAIHRWNGRWPVLEGWTFAESSP